MKWRIVTQLIFIIILTACTRTAITAPTSTSIPTETLVPTPTLTSTPLPPTATPPETLTLTPTGPPVVSTLSISNISDNGGSDVGKFNKFEITFQVNNSVAQNFQFPYDPTNYDWIDLSRHPLLKGISVDAQFLPPGQTDWNLAYQQPAFYYYEFTDGSPKTSWNEQIYKWYLSTGNTAWKVRFAPNQTGTWQYRLKAIDASGSTQTSPKTFEVNTSDNKGFIHVSSNDPRYFEFDDGSLFNSFGVEYDGPDESDNPQNLTQNGIQLIRVWDSSIFGTNWQEWLGNNNAYDSYLPRTGTESFHDVANNKDQLTLVVQANGTNSWYDPCRMIDWNGIPEAVKPNTNYRLQIKYQASNVSGPVVAGKPYGLVGKMTTSWLGDNNDNCYDSTSSKYNVTTTYGNNTSGEWAIIEGNWASGRNYFLPRIYVAMENATAGKAWIDGISLREILANGQFGPEVIREPSMQYDTYFEEKAAFLVDKSLEVAEKYGLYIKMEIMEKDDMVWWKLDDDGTYVINDEDDNRDGIYGVGRTFNRTRWLQQAWWRYIQARWGYSTAIHSFEAMNEGEPYNDNHWILADEMAKFLHCGVFGVNIGPAGSNQHQTGQLCTYKHLNRHLVTTSFWYGFPGYNQQTGEGIWGSPNYPNIDFADLHAFISTSEAGASEKSLMEKDSAYFHLWHSQQYGSWNLSMPIVRGEAGMVPANSPLGTDDFVGLGIQNDLTGDWYHDYLWSGIDSGALYEIYWYYQPHIVKSGSGGYDHRPITSTRTKFMAGIPLNNGHYQDVGATTTNQTLRLVGQKDLTNQRAYLWIQNSNHTWKNVVDRVAITPVSGAVTIAGFYPNTTLPVVWWNTYTGQASSTISATVNSQGSLILNVSNLSNDIAVKIGDYE